MMYYPQQFAHQPESYAYQQPQVMVHPNLSAQPMVQHQQYYSNPTQVQPLRISLPASQPKVKRHNPYGSPVMGSSSFSDESAFESSLTSNPLPADSSSPHDQLELGRPRGTQFYVTAEELQAHRGTLADLSRTAAGSSFIQAALREGSAHTAHNVALIASELLPIADVLLLDSHGCYVVKSVMERLAPPQLRQFVDFIGGDDKLLFSMCTHSLHTRRVVQYLMDSVDVMLVTNVLIARCEDIAMTQQGCIIMQRAMDIAPDPGRTMLINEIYRNILKFSIDPFANYVVQHMLEIGDSNSSSVAVVDAFRGHVVQLSCNKFASNVMEKCLFHLNEDAQHQLLMEMYSVTDDELHAMLQDSFGNYMIQSSIALAPFKDVFFISEKLRAVLQRTPYGHKIEQRLERRLKGRPVGTRSPQIGANSKMSRRQQHNSRDGTEPQQLVEEPW